MGCFIRQALRLKSDAYKYIKRALEMNPLESEVWHQGGLLS